jgi:signal transduction histidine kinase
VAVVRGYISMLEDGSLGRLPHAAQLAMPVLSAKIGAVNLLIDQMLDTARLEDSRLQLRRTLFDLREVAADAVDSARLLAGPGHRVRAELPEEAILVDADRSRTETILNNLVENAIKYSPDGGEVVCRLCHASGRARVEISDQGVGIAAEDLKALFTRFGRVAGEANAGIPGTGLGLYLARELARAHGGDILVQSAPGRGSTFTLDLTLVVSRPAVDLVRVPGRERRAGSSGRPPRYRELA